MIAFGDEEAHQEAASRKRWCALQDLTSPAVLSLLSGRVAYESKADLRFLRRQPPGLDPKRTIADTNSLL
jgi:hypothetical protein